MFKRFISLVLVLILALGCFAGCGGVAGDIAGNVAEAAKKELEEQVKATFEKYKADVVELKPLLGKLNGDQGKNQFFCAALVRSDDPAIPQSAADTLGKVFQESGISVQTGPKVESDYLEHKDLSFKFDSFDDGETYYLVWCYTDKIPSMEDLKDLKDQLNSTESVG